MYSRSVFEPDRQFTQKESICSLYISAHRALARLMANTRLQAVSKELSIRCVSRLSRCRGGVTASRRNKEITMTTDEEDGIKIVYTNSGRNRVTARAIAYCLCSQPQR